MVRIGAEFLLKLFLALSMDFIDLRIISLGEISAFCIILF
jgi:hypothetical protein